MALRENARAEPRRSTYRLPLNEEGRRRREENVIEIRKNKRQENLQKFRCGGAQVESSPGLSEEPSLEKLLESIPAMLANIHSDKGALHLDSTIKFRQLLSAEVPPIDLVIQSGVVPCIVSFLARQGFPQLQFEAAWVLTNIASGTSEHTQVVVDHGALPLLIKLLESISIDVREQAMWALGNIAADSPRLRNMVLENGALMPVLAQLNHHARLSKLRIATWLLTNLCKGKPPPEFEQIKPAIPVLKFLIHTNDEEVIHIACWALAYLADGPNNKIQAVIEATVIPRLVELLLHPSPLVVAPALHAIGNITSGDSTQKTYVIMCGLLQLMFNHLKPIQKRSIKQEACWIISNILAGSQENIQAVINANIISLLIDLLQNGEIDIKKEVAWALVNVTAGGTDDQIKFLVSQGCIKPMCDLLTCSEPKIVAVCLEGLFNILVVGEAERNMEDNGGVNPFAKMVEEAQGLEKIEILQSHENDEILRLAVKIVVSFWLEEDDEAAAMTEATGGDAPPATFELDLNQSPPGFSGESGFS
ncbi:Importin subunit alpha-1a [Apostasia shenzhenica]|uniref:Importin subunit alpha n=1 Tax=Apostasia shenzhenica TaxID=1088818 RepID=A0A2H9ZYM8_9ASPA|nr:Importin subunit alpha-1a [Apostasia shenzhenica]